MNASAATLILPTDVAQTMAALSNNTAECCGLLLGRFEGACAVVDEAVPSQNLAADPTKEFEIDVALRLRVQRAAREAGREVLGIYHTHPSGSAAPSNTDHTRAREEPGLIWVIAASGAVLAYQASETGLAALSITVNGLVE